jgi:amino acid adenylation domain-containing protein/thioester reductase-like protein
MASNLPLSLQQQFERQVVQTPAAVAFLLPGETADQTITFAALNGHANQLAHFLRSLGVGPDVLVAVCLERTLDLPLALLAILKAGGAYLPLDPAYPQERLAYMLADSQASILLTHNNLLNQLPASAGRTICLDDEWPALAGDYPAENPTHANTPDNLAYVVYTSGSTGRPKGVLATHRATLNRLAWMWQSYPFAPGEFCCQKTSLSFVDAVWELFGPLLQGVASVLLPPAVAQYPARLVQALDHYAVTRIVLVPSLLRAILDSPAPDLPARLARLRYWTVSGEAFPLELWQRFKAQFPNAILLNLYGSSEVAADATWYDSQWGEPAATVPIGRPIANMQVHLLDEQLRPVPPGESGHLYVGGPGLARGYLRQPGLTAARFLPDPFSPDPGRRLYQTGDLARLRPNGQLEFLGRADYQVKLRGFRIELGEIEAALAQHPAVRQAVVTLSPDPSGQPRLVAYGVADAGTAVPTLRRHLEERLPAYMLPSIIVLLDTFPLTPNGKINRSALPAPNSGRPDLSTPYLAPRTSIEAELAALWSELLGVERVGVEDNFFELGGHSIIATQFTARLYHRFQLDLPLHLLFATPTIAALAPQLTNHTTHHVSRFTFHVSPITHHAPLSTLHAPLSFAQQRLWYLEQLHPGNPAYHIAVTFRLSGRLDTPALQQSLAEIIRRHDTLRTTFPTGSGGQPIQVIAPTLDLPLTLHDLEPRPIPERIAAAYRLLTAEARRPFDLAHGPLLRAHLLRLDETNHVFFLAMHHIITDGWSMERLRSELALLYDAFTHGRPSPLPPLPFQYADFAGWQREWLQGDVLDEQLTYWQTKLAGLAPLRLPTSRPRPAARPHPAAPSWQGATYRFTLPRSLTAALQTFSRQQNATLFMTLLAAFQSLLARYSGQTDLAVGVPIANRNRPELETLIGFFVNTLVLRADLDGDPTFREITGRLRQVALDAYAHQDLPFDRLIGALQPERIADRQPLFQVMFALQTMPVETPLPAALTIDELPLDTGAAQFDLNLALEETADGLLGLLEYSTDLFDEATISRLAAHYQTLLTAAVANPDLHLSQLPLLTPAETHQLLVTWNDTRRDHPELAAVSTPTIHTLVEAQVRRTPDAVAIRFPAANDQIIELTYQELNQQANRLAHHLRDLGVRPGVTVAFCLERSPTMLVALLAVLKAGAAYLSLDPTYPQERLAYMLADSAAPLILTQQRPAAQLPPSQARLVHLDPGWQETMAHLPAANPNLPLSGESPAYLVYTSGSTGRPKGVLVPHRALVNHSLAIAAYYDLRPTDRVLQFASISFDVAAEELFPTWLRGATVVLRPDELLAPTGGLQPFLADHQISVANLPTSYWHEWVLEIDRLHRASFPPCLRLVIVGTERALPDSLAAWQRLVGDAVRWLNAYGPSETTITTTIYDPGNSPADQASGVIAIGRPLANAHLYLVDAALNPVPIGVPGEILIGGPGLAHGYLHQPGLTAEKFIPNPFGGSGQRLYRTGDMARYRPDGNLEFLGRVDNQVKIRGFRVEPGEVEAVLRQHPLVQESAVTVYEDQPGEPRLVAYYVPRDREDQLELWPCPGDYQLFDEVMYYAMTHDTRRNARYQAAIRRLVPGKVVLDIGTGKDAILARLCAAAGARHVYALERQPEAYRQAIRTVAQAGLSDLITVLFGDAQTATLPEPVDVCVSELIGTIGSSEGAVSILNDAHRFLKPDGRMIPERCLTNIAAVSLPAELAHEPAFTELSAYYAGQIIAKVGHPLDFRLAIKNFPHNHLHSTTAIFEDLDFRRPQSPEFDRHFRLTIEQDSLIDGFLLWLNLHTVEGELIDNLAEPYSWLPVYWPIWYPGVQVSQGDVIEATGRSRLSEDGLNPDYEISGRLYRQNSEVIPFHSRSPLYSAGYRHHPFYQKLFAGDAIPISHHPRAELLPADLKHFLEAHLPAYMIPSHFLLLDTLPRLPNGKVNRPALPAPDRSRPDLAGYQPPRDPAEQLLAGIWRDVLALEEIGVYDNFFDLGGHSLLATQIVFRTREAFQVELPLRRFLENPTIAGLAATIEAIRQNTPEALAPLDLEAEATLDPAITPRPTGRPPRPAPSAIFLTGATGFLGSYLLHETLQQTTEPIYCLVRAADETAGRRRLQQTLATYQLWQDQFDSRLHPIPGDLAQPLLGLSPAAFDTLANRIQQIYHNGALVNFIYPYTKLKPANVLGTAELLRLATAVHPIPVHYISTLSIFESAGYLGPNHPAALSECDPPDHPVGLLYGYAQSKWVAEKLVHTAGERGLPVTIYRLAEITGHSLTGRWPAEDYLARFLHACLQLGAIPDQDELLYWTPVDFAAQAIVHLAQQPNTAGRTFHLLNPHPIPLYQLAPWLNDLGYPIQAIPYADWQARLIAAATRTPDHPLAALLPLFVEPLPQVGNLTLGELFTQERTPLFTAPHTTRLLAAAGLECPPLDKKLLYTYIHHLIH